MDLEIFAIARKVVGSLQNRDCKEALKWCSDNKSKLKKINVGLVEAIDAFVLHC